MMRSCCLRFYIGGLILAAQAIAAEPSRDNPPEWWSLHGQATTVTQLHPAIVAPYSGENSLKAESELETSFTSTLYLGGRLWKGTEVYVNPELTAGAGFSRTRGIAAFPNAEIYRVDTPSLRAYVSRVFARQIIALGDESEVSEPGPNQLAGKQPVDRLTVTVGKFSLNDAFDNNVYSHDPRSQFLNWVFMDNGAWDYAADTRGYTWAVAAEYNRAAWAVRLGVGMVPASANGLEFDTNIGKAHGDNLEVEYRYAVYGQSGKVRVLGYMNHARMGSYAAAIVSPTPDITQSRDYRTKYGLGVNVEQQISADIGVFVRLGWNDGKTETWAFTEIDHVVSLGVSVKGGCWGRERDTFGAAVALGGLSSEHAEYLERGGLGFIIGDGRLNYGTESVLELYYQWKPFDWFAFAPDYQFVNHPAHNRDRGPVNVFSGRLHIEL